MERLAERIGGRPGDVAASLRRLDAAGLIVWDESTRYLVTAPSLFGLGIKSLEKKTGQTQRGIEEYASTANALSEDGARRLLRALAIELQRAVNYIGATGSGKDDQKKNTAALIGQFFKQHSIPAIFLNPATTERIMEITAEHSPHREHTSEGTTPRSTGVSKAEQSRAGTAVGSASAAASSGVGR